MRAIRKSRGSLPDLTRPCRQTFLLQRQSSRTSLKKLRIKLRGFPQESPPLIIGLPFPGLGSCNAGGELKDGKYNMQQINLRVQHLSCRKWWMRMMSAAIVSLLCVVLLDYQTQAQMKVDVDPMMEDRYSGSRTPEEIFEVFRDRKMNQAPGAPGFPRPSSSMPGGQKSLSEPFWADAHGEQFHDSCRLQQPCHGAHANPARHLEKVHGETEPLFFPGGSVGPSVNILVSAEILRDLYDKYRGMGYQEPELWDHVFSAYYSGEGSVRGGLHRRHLHYVNKVRAYIGEYSQKLDG